MNISFTGYQNLIKQAIDDIQRKTCQMADELDEKYYTQKKEEIFDRLEQISDFVDSVHNIVYGLLAQDTDVKTLEQVRDVRSFLGFDKERWGIRKNCLVVFEEKPADDKKNEAKEYGDN